MEYRNTEQRYGTVAKCLHWIIATAILVQIGIMAYINLFLTDASPFKSYLMTAWHKPIGLASIVLTLLSLHWYLTSPRPRFPIYMQAWEKRLATTVHRCLLLSAVFMPICGLLMSVAAGHLPSFFGLFTIPQFIAKNHDLALLMFDFHSWTACILMGLLALHLAGVCKHLFIHKDNILKRMS